MLEPKKEEEVMVNMFLSVALDQFSLTKPLEWAHVLRWRTKQTVNFDTTFANSP